MGIISPTHHLWYYEILLVFGIFSRCTCFMELDRMQDMPKRPTYEELESKIADLSKALADTRVNLHQETAKRTEAEAEFKESEKRYWSLLDNSLVGLYRTKTNGEILYVNDALAKILDYSSRDELITTDARLRYKNPADRDRLIEELSKKRES